MTFKVFGGKLLARLGVFLLMFAFLCSGYAADVFMVSAAETADESGTEDPSDADSSAGVQEEYNMLEMPDIEDGTATERGLLSSGTAASILGEILNMLDQGERKIKDCEVEKIPDQIYTGKAIRPSVKITYLGYSLRRGTDYTLTYSANTRVGTAKVKITGKGRYTGTKTVSFRIVRKGTASSGSSSGSASSSSQTKTKKFTVKLSTASYVYNGKYRKPTVKVTAGGKSISSRYYTVKYTDNRGVGNAIVTVTGKGDYKGYTGTAVFKITMKKAVISGVKSNAAGELTVKVTGDAQADGYQIEVCSRKTFSGTIKKETLRSGTSLTITGLESGRKYYIRIRSYKKVGTSNWYSEYSTVRTATVK